MTDSKEKILITSGCSFSELNPYIDTWPVHLAERMPQHTHVSKGMCSQGNGLISRSIIHACTTHKDSDLFVGILWSGIDRHDFYLRDSGISENIDGWEENPTGFTNTKNWVILNGNWQNQFAKSYYGMFHDAIGQVIYTLEHILRTQWFLKQHKIPYFMSTYIADVLEPYTDDENCYLEDCKYLYDQIDWNCFLPIDGMADWVDKNVGQQGFAKPGDLHPSTLGHKEFTEQVIMPFVNRGKNNETV